MIHSIVSVRIIRWCPSLCERQNSRIIYFPSDPNNRVFEPRKSSTCSCQSRQILVLISAERMRSKTDEKRNTKRFRYNALCRLNYFIFQKQKPLKDFAVIYFSGSAYGWVGRLTLSCIKCNWHDIILSQILYY
jgi:hypothetical protein